MKIGLYRVFISIVCMLFLYSCISDFSKIGIDDLPKSKDSFSSTIVIQGIISSELDYQTVMLSKTVALGAEPEYISGAVVEIKIGDKTYEYIESEYHSLFSETKKRKGLYVSIEKIQGVVGMEHTLHVLYNENEYYASDSMTAVTEFEIEGANLPRIKESILFDGNSMQKDTTLNFGGIYFCQPESYMLNWSWLTVLFTSDTIDFDRVWHSSYYFSKIENPEINNFSKHSLNVYPMLEVVDSLVIVKKFSISQAYQTFLIASFKEIYWNRTRFSSIPSNISTNVTNGGKGFFAACDVTSRQIVYKDLLDKVKQNK